jgi:hypothetical protein
VTTTTATTVVMMANEIHTASTDDNGNDETIDSKHTSHDDWNDVTHNELGLDDTHSRHSDSGLSGTIGSSEA